MEIHMPNPSPTLRRRSLSLELARLRKAKGMTAEQVDRAHDWTKGKVARMERNEWVLPDKNDIALMLDTYEVTDAHKRDELLLWAKQGRERGWWHPYRNMLSEAYTTFIGLEYGASELRTWELAVVPGILQTPDYARGHLNRWPGELNPKEIDDRVEIRTQRQQILHRENPARLRAVIDEAAIRRAAGGTEVMRAQLLHLVQMAELPRVEIQVIPFEAGTHAGTQGPFTMLDFAEGEPPAVYVENVAGELFLEQEEEIARFRRTFERLTAVALSPVDSIGMFSQVAKTLA